MLSNNINREDSSGKTENLIYSNFTIAISGHKDNSNKKMESKIKNKIIQTARNI